MTIQDTVGNVLITQTSPMLGFRPLDVRAALSLKLYNFIIESIRIEDQINGDQFLERFLNGAQEQWEYIDAKIKSLPNLLSISDVEDEYLQYLKWIVGWTSELDYITDGLDNLTLRRLIAASVPFWKKRGTENTIIDIQTLTTAARLRIWNWFDLRFIMDETEISEEHEGRDPWMLSLPGSPDYEENNYEIRIVDDGNLDRELVLNLAKLTRPSGERVTIYYIGFLDLFTTINDVSQWFVPDFVNGDVMSVSGGTMTFGNLTSTLMTYATVDWADWDQIVYGTRIKYTPGTSAIFRMIFNYVDSNNYYYAQAYLYGNPTTLIRFWKVKSGAVEFLDQEYIPFEIYADVWYYFRCTAVNVGTSKELKFFVDGEEYLSYIDTDLIINGGSVGFRVTNLIIDIDEVEVFEVPLDSDFIDINS